MLRTPLLRTAPAIVAIAAAISVLAAAVSADEARAQLGPAYQANWTSARCSSNGHIGGTHPLSVKSSAPSEWIAWRTHLSKLINGVWVYQGPSAWRVVLAYGGVVPNPADGGDDWTIYQAGKYALVGEVYYYNAVPRDSAFTTIRLVMNSGSPLYEDFYTGYCAFGGA